MKLHAPKGELTPFKSVTSHRICILNNASTKSNQNTISLERVTISLGAYIPRAARAPVLTARHATSHLHNSRKKKEIYTYIRGLSHVEARTSEKRALSLSRPLAHESVLIFII